MTVFRFMKLGVAMFFISGIPVFSQTNPRSFVVYHVHPGFGHSTVQGVLRLTKGRLSYSETGAGSNTDDNFEVGCKVIENLDENGTGSDKHQVLFHVKLENKNYNFYIDRSDYKPLRDEFLTDTCAR
jgi:hypothetical protein